MTKQYCIHPNCKLVATKPHPAKTNKEANKFCVEHYNEVLDSTKRVGFSVAMTCHDED